MDPIIQLKKVSKIHAPNIVALDDVSLTVYPKEFVYLIGKSGAGKTSILKLLIAHERPSKGVVTIGDWDITDIKRADIPHLRRQLGVVFQDFQLLPKKTVYENVAFALEACGSSGGRIKSIIPQVLAIVSLDDKANQYPHELSGGEKQRVAIARALVHRPKILLADEPTGNLDTISSKEILELLLKINDFGTTVVVVTHNKDMVNMKQKRVITIEEGKIISDHDRGHYTL